MEATTKQIDIVYPIGKKSYWNDQELTYSLRSVEKHLSNVRNVWIVGRVPDQITNVSHIPATDPHPIPDLNIMEKVLKACEHPDISDPFLFFNDDHYILHDFDATDFPDFYFGTLEDYFKRRGGDGYGLRARNTMNLLKGKGLPTKYFDVHFPILYRKQEFIDNVVKAIDIKKPHGFILKSLYGNSLQLEGTPLERDCKSHTVPGSKAICFSTLPRVSGAVYQFLKYKFPNASRYEK